VFDSRRDLPGTAGIANPNGGLGAPYGTDVKNQGSTLLDLKASLEVRCSNTFLCHLIRTLRASACAIDSLVVAA
jgi:hypothetical protein